jgi:tripartite ATP-independent transporter DctP family solute receptor
MHVSRRGLMLGTAAALTLPALQARGQGRTIRMTIAHNSAPSSPKGMGATKFAELVNAHTRGRVEVHVAPSEQLGNENTNMAAIRTGTLEFGSLGQGALLSVAPEVAAIGLPFLFSSMPAAWQVLDGPVGRNLAQRLESRGMVFLGWWCNGIRQLTNNRRPVNRPEDLRGLKIRTPLDPATVDMFAAMGAVPQQINWGEVYLALQTGVVDGQENPLANIHAAKLHEVQRYVSMTSHKYEPTGLIMSTMAWRRLNDDDRGAVRAAAAEAGAYQRNVMKESEERLLGEFRRMPNIQVNDMELEPFRRATETVWDAWEQKPFGDFVKLLRAARA